MTKCKLVTIVCEPVLSISLTQLIRQAGATGFTLTEVKGEGSGEKNTGEVPDDKLKIEIVCDEPLASKIMSDISRQYFESYSLILYASDVQVIRPAKF